METSWWVPSGCLVKAHEGLEGGNYKEADQFTKSKLCLANLTAFCDEMTSSADEGKSVSVIYFDFSKVFSTNSQSFSQMRERVDGWMY